MSGGEEMKIRGVIIAVFLIFFCLSPTFSEETSGFSKKLIAFIKQYAPDTKIDRLIKILTYQKKIAGSRLNEHFELIIPSETVYVDKNTRNLAVITLDPKGKITFIKLIDSQSGKEIFVKEFKEGTQRVDIPTELLKEGKNYKILVMLSYRDGNTTYTVKTTDTFTIYTPKEIPSLETKLEKARETFKNPKEYHLAVAAIFDSFSKQNPLYDFSYNRNLELYLSKTAR